MKGAMRISLRNGERIYVNGAVLRVDRKVAIELLNDVTFLLESQVMQVADANTPLRQLYFIVQLLLINPADTCKAISLFRLHIEAMRAVVQNADMLKGMATAESLVGRRPALRSAQDDPCAVSRRKRHHGRNQTGSAERGRLGTETSMEVNSVTTTTSGTDTSTSSTSQLSSTVDYNTFLQLLVAEMKNQDPTAPTDTAQFMSQFAQFSTVEQAIQTNTKLDALLTSSAFAQADNLIGRTASFVSTDGEAVSSKITSIRIISGGGAVANLEDGSSVALDAGVTIS